MKNINEEKAIEIKGLYKNFKEKSVLKDVNLSVGKSSFHALIGENGAGKTTLIKSILGLFVDVEGEVAIHDISNLEKESREFLFYFPTNANFPSSLNLYNYLFSIYLLHESKVQKIKVNLMNYLKKYDLWEIRKNNPNKFSSGQKKKVYLIISLIRNAKVFILDEPTANLDPNTRRQFYEDLEELRESGITIFVSTHNLAEISKYVTEASFLYDGSIFWNGQISQEQKLEELYFKLLHSRMEKKNDK